MLIKGLLRNLRVFKIRLSPRRTETAVRQERLERLLIEIYRAERFRTTEKHMVYVYTSAY